MLSIKLATLVILSLAVSHHAEVAEKIEIVPLGYEDNLDNEYEKLETVSVLHFIVDRNLVLLGL